MGDYRIAMATPAQDVTAEHALDIVSVLIGRARYEVDRNAGGGSALDIAEQELAELVKISDGLTNTIHAR